MDVGCMNKLNAEKSNEKYKDCPSELVKKWFQKILWCAFDAYSEVNDKSISEIDEFHKEILFR